MDIPKGIFAFTSDHEEIGWVTAVEDRFLTIRLRGADASVVVPRTGAEHIHTGRLELPMDAATLRTDYLSKLGDEAMRWGTREARPVGHVYVPCEVVETLWDELSERRWKALHDIAHQEDERKPRRIAWGVLNDVMLVSRHMEEQDSPFPTSLQEFCDALNRAAESLPHETSGR